LNKELKRIIDHILARLPETRLQREGKLFLVCLIISFFFWLMIKLSNEYYDNLTIDVNYYNLPDKNTIIDQADDKITLVIKTRGFKLIGLKYFVKFPPININLREIQLHKSRYSYSSFILTSPLLNNIANQLNMPDEILSVSPDTLILTLENIARKKVAVFPDLEITLQKQYQLYGSVVLDPDSIYISGPPSIIDTLNHVATKSIKLENINSTTSINTLILKPADHKKLYLSADSVRINISVEKFTEETLEIPITITGIDSLRVKLFPGKVMVTYLVALKDFDKVNNEMFKAMVSINEKTMNEPILKVELVQWPAFVTITQVTPGTAEFLMLKP